MKKEREAFIMHVPNIVAIVFALLKLTGEIDWSWWAVTSPIWISAIALMILLVIGLLINANKR